MMLRSATRLRLDAVEPALRRAAQKNEAGLISSVHVGQHLPEGSAQDAIVFSLCHAELYAALLEAEVRLSAFLPCRVAAYASGGETVLESVSPLEFCRILNRPDLAPLAAALEALLSRVMDEAARPQAEPTHATASVHRGGLGATEDQVNLRGHIPQRIDCRGTKVEDLAGTGDTDTQGG